jgi:hypothetical protein
MQSATTTQEDSMYSIEDFSEGQRVEIHPATDLWMRGARYGVVVKVGLMSVHVRLDASFFRYRGELYDLGEFMSTRGMPEFSPLVKWDGYSSDSYFSGTLVRYVDQDHDMRVVVGRFYS